MNRFGQRLRQARERNGMRLKDLADALGWSVVYLSDIELGRRNPPATDKIFALAALLHEPTEEFLNSADTDRQRVELELDERRPHLTEAALMLARSWNGLSDDDALLIKQILAGRKAEPNVLHP
jgi:transcriptional regulator with XRE-family HTH domain